MADLRNSSLFCLNVNLTCSPISALNGSDGPLAWPDASPSKTDTSTPSGYATAKCMMCIFLTATQINMYVA